VPSGAFIIKVGKRMFATETQTCESFAKMDSEPPEGMGKLMGTFRVKKGELVFVKEARATRPPPTSESVATLFASPLSAPPLVSPLALFRLRAATATGDYRLAR
jgi:hypothetical protein